MNFWKLITGIGFVFYLSLVAESKTMSTNVTRSDKTVPPKNGPAYKYPTPILFKEYCQMPLYNTEHRHSNYSTPHHPIFAFGLEKFLSYGAHFCKYESESGSLEVVSVGSGDGVIENDIITAYANHFRGELSITLVDPDPKYRADFPRVNDLIAERVSVVGNCVLIIIWPEVLQKNDGYDIQAIYKLQPRAVLTMYEMTGISGSSELIGCLNPPGDVYADSEGCSPGLDNYVIEDTAYQQVNNDPGPLDFWGSPIDVPIGVPAFKLRLVKLKRTD